MSDYVNFTFYIDDGYANVHGAPHTVRLDRETMEGMDDDDLHSYVEDEIRVWMSQNLYPVFEISELREQLAEDND